MSVTIPNSVVIDQGADFYLNVTWLDANGNSYNLTGYTATFTLRQDFGKPIIWTLTESSGLTLGGSAGTIGIHATNAQTSQPEGLYVVELMVTNGSVKTSLLKGHVALKAKVAP
jgi:hypothetical protein